MHLSLRSLSSCIFFAFHLTHYIISPFFFFNQSILSMCYLIEDIKQEKALKIGIKEQNDFLCSSNSVNLSF